MEKSGKANNLRCVLGAILTTAFKREKLIVVEKTLSDTDVKIKTRVDVDIKFVQREDFPKVADKFKKFKHFPYSNFGTGNICIVGEISGEIVHWVWVSFNQIHVSEVERKIRMNSDSVYIGAGYTVPEYRGFGIAPRATEKICDYLYSRGFAKIYGLIRPDNFPCRRYCYKIGFKEIGLITFTKIFKLKLYGCKGETKKDYITLTRMFSIE